MRASIVRAPHFGQAGRWMRALTLSGKKIGFLRDASLKGRRERNNSLTGSVPSTVIGITVVLKVPVRCSILLSFSTQDETRSTQPFGNRLEFSTT
jgi:hypothetical protein